MLKPPRQNKEEIINAFKASGQTQKAWCLANDVNYHNLKYWLSQEKKSTAESEESETTQWLTLRVKEDSLVHNTQVLHIHSGNLSVAVQPGFDPQHLLQVLHTLSML